MCYVENGRCSLVSRRGNVFTRFDALGEQVASALCRDVVSELGVDEAILDGEVIVADETGRHAVLRSSPAHAPPDLRRIRPSVVQWHRFAVSAAPRAPAATARDLAARIAVNLGGGVSRAARARALSSDVRP